MPGAIIIVNLIARINRENYYPGGDVMRRAVTAALFEKRNTFAVMSAAGRGATRI